MKEIDRIKANDTKLTEISLFFAVRSADAPIYDALVDNTSVKVLKIEFGGADSSSLLAPTRLDYLALVQMLNANQTIEEVHLIFLQSDAQYRFESHLYMEATMSALIKYGSGIRLKRLVICDEECKTGLYQVDEFLKKNPTATQELKLYCRENVHGPEMVLKAVATTGLQVLELSKRTWYRYSHLASALGQPHCRLETLSLDFSTSEEKLSKNDEMDAWLLWDTLADSNKSLKCLKLVGFLQQQKTDDRLWYLLQRLEDMQHLQKICLQNVDYTHLEATCKAIHAHGKLETVELACCLNVDATGYVPVNFDSCVFDGIQDLSLTVSIHSQHALPQTDVADAIVLAVCCALKKCLTMKKLCLWVEHMTDRAFEHITTVLAPSLPTLDTLDLDEFSISMDLGRMVLQAVQQCPKLLRVVARDSSQHLNAALVLELNHYFERNRIGFDQLIVDDENKTCLLPASVWPLILANVGRRDVLYALLQERGAWLLENRNIVGGVKRKLPFD